MGERMTEQGNEIVRRLEKNISQVVLGKTNVIRYCLVALLSEEHILLEDVPGVGKTLVGKALSKSISGGFCRLQFTPDLLPSDILGSTVFNMKTSEFSYNRGPIFSNIVLADEINRAPPRTQSALLEAMSDGQVSIDGATYPLPKPFVVIATQNPYEFEGTYVLPESQLDRFLMRISMGYPSRDFEREVLRSHRFGEPVQQLSSVASPEQIVELQAHVRSVEVEDSLMDYILDIVHATREDARLSVGVSTRGMLSFYRAVQAFAYLEGRSFSTPDDVKFLAVPVLAHRVVVKGHMAGSQREVAEDILTSLVEHQLAPG